ncbi:hypothetical protein HID58_057956, partial [Brassica napus]
KKKKLQMLYGLWESGYADDKRSTPREDYMERLKHGIKSWFAFGLIKQFHSGDRYEEGDITPRPMMKFKAAGADVWDPKWDAHPIGGGAKKMLTREELFERANPVDDPPAHSSQ